LKNADNAPFGWADILYASEIGFIVDDVAAAAAAVKDVAAVTQYKEGDDQFVAMGDEYGLLLMMKRGRIIDFTSNADNGARVYRTGVTVRGSKVTKHQFSSHPYELTVEERCSCA
jgi:phage protein D